MVFGYEAKVGEAAVLQDSHRWCLGRRVALLRARRDLLDPRFLAYAWRAPAFQETLRANLISGSTIGGPSRCVAVANGTYSLAVEKRRGRWVVTRLDLTLITFNPVFQSGAGC